MTERWRRLVWLRAFGKAAGNEFGQYSIGRLQLGAFLMAVTSHLTSWNFAAKMEIHTKRQYLNMATPSLPSHAHINNNSFHILHIFLPKHFKNKDTIFFFFCSCRDRIHSFQSTYNILIIRLNTSWLKPELFQSIPIWNCTTSKINYALLFSLLAWLKLDIHTQRHYGFSQTWRWKGPVKNTEPH